VSSASISESCSGAHFPAAVGDRLLETEVDGSVLATDEESAVLPQKSADAASISYSDLPPLEKRLCTRQFSGSFALV
jgi:hypothetical protein